MSVTAFDITICDIKQQEINTENIQYLPINLSENELSRVAFDAGLKVHKALGPGLLESAYEECLNYELIKQGVKVEKQKALPLVYEEIKLDAGYRVDFLIENKLTIEIKLLKH